MSFTADDFQLPECYRGKTRSLFWEHRFVNNGAAQNPPVFNLMGYDHNGTLSLEKLYLKYNTEYDAAIAILGSWPHWKKLCKCKWFKPYKEAWDEERKTRDEALARTTLLVEAEKGNVSAARALLAKENNSKKNTTTGAGRPNNKQALTDSDPRDEEQLDSMIKRFKVVNGTKES